MNKIKVFVILFSILLLAFAHSLFAKAEWTVLVYMAADNNLSQSAFKDINEMETVDYSDSINVVVQVDPNDNLSYPPYFSEARRYYIKYDENPDSIGSRLLDNLGEIDTSAPGELSSFANWGFDKYPSRKKMLIIWDHGNGWRQDNVHSIKSLCYDNSHNSRMSVARGELAEGIANINENIDILIFDACLMQMAEVIGEIYNGCDIVMGCEMDVPSDGIFYGDYSWSPDSKYGLLNYISKFPVITSTELAKEIVSRYIGSYVSGVQTGGNTSMSAIDCAKFDEYFLPSVRDFSLKFADTTYYDSFHSAYDNCHLINSDKCVDSRQFFRNLSDLASDSLSIMAAEVEAYIDSVVIKSLAYVNNSIDDEIGRFAINLPKYINNFSDWQLYSNLEFVKRTRWDRFIAFFHKDYPNSNVSPIINKFSVHDKGEYIQASWEALAPTFIDYELRIITENDFTQNLLPRDYSINYFDTTLSSGYYELVLTAIDEFSNEQDTARTIEVKSDNFFAFYPNPFKAKKYDKAYFLCSSKNWENPSIKIFNQNGEMVEKIMLEPTEKQVKKIEYNAGKLASGIYFSLLTNADSVRKIKFAIIH
ncbi:MAG: hypothetical protein KGY75_01630 [Candidatus Cloacimonetes bacterium]|nr:hypothetical protein [Candidatus Cloacimonadota bacterium]MBS3766811.1 hypothetical protein [Candidatus Cloacimonadota bacterium]